jgi:hypothetical protein
MWTAIRHMPARRVEASGCPHLRNAARGTMSAVKRSQHTLPDHFNPVRNRTSFLARTAKGDGGCDVDGAVVYKSERIALRVMISVGAAPDGALRENWGPGGCSRLTLGCSVAPLGGTSAVRLAWDGDLGVVHFESAERLLRSVGKASSRIDCNALSTWIAILAVSAPYRLLARGIKS